MQLPDILLLGTLRLAAGFVTHPCGAYCKPIGVHPSPSISHVQQPTTARPFAANRHAVLSRKRRKALCIARDDAALEVKPELALSTDDGDDRDDGNDHDVVTVELSTTASETTFIASYPSKSSTSVPLPDGAMRDLFLLNAVTVLWGTQHAVIKLILQSDLSPGMTNLARFGLAAVVFSPWTPGLLRHPPPLPFSPKEDIDVDGGAGEHEEGEEERATSELLGADAPEAGGDFVGIGETWRAGAELGGWMFLGFGFQAIGLGFTTASRSAFLLYLNVKLVPFFAFLLERRSISIPTWVGAFLAFFGTVLLSSDGTPPNVGDFWSILAAATSAMFILRLEKYTGRCEASQLNSANLWVTAGLCSLWAAWEVLFQGVDPNLALQGVRTQGPFIAYLAIVTTALTNWMQALGQKSVPAERAAVIYAMDPVYAAGFAYLLLGETLGATGLAGAAIITAAAVWSQQQQAAGDSSRGGDIGSRV